MSLIKKINEIVKNTFINNDYEVNDEIVKISDRPDLSQFQCNEAFNLAKKYKKNPRMIAEEIVNELKQNDMFKEISVDGPGFINISLKEDYIATYIEENFSNIDLKKYNSNKKKILVDYGGPNVAKPLHVGHLRPAIIGEGLKRLAIELGNDVIGDVHLGDWGRQMGMIISEIKYRYPDLVYFDNNYTGEYPAESPVTVDDLNEIYPTATAKAKEDEERMEEAREATSILQNDYKEGHKGYYELWKKLVEISVEDLKKSYEKLDVHFELWRGESDCHKSIPKMIEELEKNNLLKDSDGAKIIEVNEETDSTEIPPVIVKTKSDSVGYQATELATIYERMEEFNPDEIWYVVDGRQELHFRQVFRAAYKSGIVKEDTLLYHAGFGTMNGKDGKPFKTRDGGVMRLSELLELTEKAALAKINSEIENKEEIAAIIADGAIKYADAISNRTTDYVFDVDKFTDNQGKTGPYVLYSAVRINSLLRKAQENNIKIGKLINTNTLDEKLLMLQIIRLPDIIMDAYKRKSLSEIVNYLFDLNSAYNNFYNNCRILSEKNIEKQESWMKLSYIVGEINKKLLYIMAIRIPNKM
ncbi:MAG: arginine--tRNA ligase [Clostridia bacterium]|nr:arginine--tRNA ligase [Clostridia bacterium]